MTATVADAVLLRSLTLVAVTVYRPAVAGAVNVTLSPLWLTPGLNDATPGLIDQATLAESLVVAESGTCWLAVAATYALDKDTDISAEAEELADELEVGGGLFPDTECLAQLEVRIITTETVNK